MLGQIVAVTEAVQDYRITTAEVGNIIAVGMMAIMMAAVMAMLGKITMKAAEVEV